MSLIIVEKILTEKCMTEPNDILERLKFQHVLREYFHNAVESKTKHYSWLIISIFGACGYIYINLEQDKLWIEWMIISILLIIAHIISRFAFFVIQTESKYLEEANKEYLNLINKSSNSNSSQYSFVTNDEKQFYKDIIKKCNIKHYYTYPMNRNSIIKRFFKIHNNLIKRKVLFIDDFIQPTIKDANLLAFIIFENISRILYILSCSYSIYIIINSKIWYIIMYM